MLGVTDWRVFAHIKTRKMPDIFFHHKEAPSVSLVWGDEGKIKSKGHGLAKILKWHPEVDPANLQGLFDKMEAAENTSNSIVLRGGGFEAVIRRNMFGKPHDWVLTTYGKESADAQGEGLDSTKATPSDPIPGRSEGGAAQSNDAQSGGESQGSFSLAPRSLASVADTVLASQMRKPETGSVYNWLTNYWRRMY